MKFKVGYHIKHKLFDYKVEIVHIDNDDYRLNNGEIYSIEYIDHMCDLDFDYYRKEKIKKLL